MKVRDLIIKLGELDLDSVPVIHDADTGWALNIASVKQVAPGFVAITGTYTDENLKAPRGDYF